MRSLPLLALGIAAQIAAGPPQDPAPPPAQGKAAAATDIGPPPDMAAEAKAERVLRQALQLAPDDAFSLKILGMAHYMTARFDDAAKTHPPEKQPPTPESKHP